MLLVAVAHASDRCSVRVKGPHVGSRSALGGQENKRAWVSGDGPDERLGSPRSRGRFATSRARNRDLRWNRLFFGVGSFVAALRGPLTHWIIHDRGGVSKSEGIVRAMNRKEFSGGELTTKNTNYTKVLKYVRANHEPPSQQVSRSRPRNDSDLTLPIAVADAKGRSFS